MQSTNNFNLVNTCIDINTENSYCLVHVKGSVEKGNKSAEADPGFTEGGFRTVMCTMRAREKF